MDEIYQAIPHRPPFLFVDEIVSITDTGIVAAKTLDPEEAFFKGHYPGYPIMPGVLLCEAIFQAAAIFLSHTVAVVGEREIPVLTRISNARFKNMVFPGDRLRLRAQLVEQMQNVFFMKGSATVDGRAAVTVEFACALAEKKAIKMGA